MKNSDVIDEVTQKRVSVKKLNIWLLCIYGGIVFSIPELVRASTGQPDTPEMNFNVLTAVMILSAAGGFALGLLVALVPFRGLSWRRKYLSASIFCGALSAITILIMMVISNQP